MIYPRTSWGGPAEPIGHTTAGAKLLVIAHHSYIPHLDCGMTKAKERSSMLGMHNYAAGKGWGGFSYGHAVYQSGNVHEGRGWARTGAHTIGRNSSSHGIVFVIDGEKHKPTSAAIESFHDLIAVGIRGGHIARAHEVAPHDRFQQKVCPGQFIKASGILGGVIPPVHHGSAIAPMPTLRKGDGGNDDFPDIYEAVRELQRRLGMPDRLRTGYFGDLTDAAVREFQREHGLVVDGIVGPATWQARGA